MNILEEKQLRIVRSFLRGKEPRCSVADFEVIRKAIPNCFQIESRFGYNFSTHTVLVPIKDFTLSWLELVEYFTRHQNGT